MTRPMNHADVSSVFRPLGMKLWRVRAALLERAKRGDNAAARWAAAVGEVIAELHAIDCCIGEAAAERSVGPGEPKPQHTGNGAAHNGEIR